MGQNPAVGSQNAGLMRRALANLKWVVVRDLAEIESAAFWKDAPEVRDGELRTEDIATEVFLMPAASHIEKDGSFTNTQRLVQWHDRALEPPGDARSELWFMHHLFKRVRAHYARSTAARDWPIVNLAGTTRSWSRTATRTSSRCSRRSTATTWPPRSRSPASPSSRRTARPRRAAGSTPASTRTRSTRRSGATPATSRPRAAGSRPSGRGRGRPTAGCSTTARPRTRTASRGRSARSTCGGTRTRAPGAATTSRTSPPTSAPTTGPRRTRPAWMRSPAPSRT